MQLWVEHIQTKLKKLLFMTVIKWIAIIIILLACMPSPVALHITIVFNILLGMEIFEISWKCSYTNVHRFQELLDGVLYMRLRG